MGLPSRSREAEDAYVAELRDAAGDEVRSAVMDALGDGRVQLAARLVGLLPEDGDPDLEKARRAARFLLTQRDPVVEEELSVLMARLHERRRQRFQRRHTKRPKHAPKPSKWKTR